jgi:hypothetical protein
MARETYYTLLVNGEAKRINDDLQRIKGMALDFMKSGNLLSIRCPHAGGSDAQAAILNYDAAKVEWVRTK